MQLPGGLRKDASVRNRQDPHQPNGRTSSINSAWDRIIRRQQYRFNPRASRTCLASSPWRVRSTNAGNALPTTLPHVKHRTGMIMDSPVRLLPLLARATAQRLLRELAAGNRGDHGEGVFSDKRFGVPVGGGPPEAAGHRRTDRV